MVCVSGSTESTFQQLTRRISLYVLAPLLLVSALPVSVHILQKPDLGLAVHRLQIQAVAPDGPAARAGLREGDRVVAFAGRPVTQMVDWFTLTAGDYGLQTRRLTVARNGTLHELEIQPRRPSRSRMVYGLSIWLAGILFLLIGWWVHSRRHDAVGRNFFGLCFIFAFFLADLPELPAAKYQIAKQVIRELLQYLWPVYFLRFFLRLPATGIGTARRGDRLLFLPALLLIAATLVALALRVSEDSLAASLLQRAAALYFVVYFLVGLVVFARNVLRRDRPVLHTKLRVILLGLAVGLLPFLVASSVGGGNLPAFPHWEYLGFSLLLVPVSFGLAIMRYGALDTEFVVRASLVYGLVTILIIAAYILGAAVLGNWLTRVYQVSAYPVLVLTLAACSLAVLPLRRQVQSWVDAAFYPSRRANRETLTRLGRDMAIQVSAEEAHALLLDRLHHLYRPTRISLYLSTSLETGTLQEVGRRPAAGTAGPTVSGDDPLLVCLHRLRRPLFREELEDMGLVRTATSAARDLALQPNELLVPLVTGNRLLGLLLFGPKDGGALYSQEDLANLGNLALQTAPMLESLRLHTERLRQRQLQTELTVAREIQAQLLPTEPLAVADVEICGRNDSCREVGGDYYDYFLLPESNLLAFCVADVAGKGIPAALLMTTVRVTFRELARPDIAADQVIAELDRRIGEVLAPDRFISFFYGVLDLQRRLLTYCNAGLEPPLLFRREGEPVSLRRGGPVLGIKAGVPYRRGTLRLAPGDLLIGYTDGITEQTSPDGGEFFEVERLLSMVAASRERSPTDLCREIFARVTEFGGDAATDDRTVIIMKIM
ncbi:MAG: SpoIIE family protein phosphatase [Candidatus Krumholzibacteria bacterium]|nr:SpoIIE family protein phosphatase [Candidatus Krumholzibacteria bacterium]